MKSINNLDDFVSMMNEGLTLDVDSSLLESEAIEYGKQATVSMLRQWAPREDGNTLRVSSLGRPAVLQALTTFGYHEGARPNRLRRIFSRGDVDEAEVIALMNAHGFSVHQQQEEIEWNGVLGHIDGVVYERSDFDDEGYSTVFDMKTTQPYKFDTWKKKGIDNDGYLTQIAVYQEALGTDNAAIIFSNKANSELAVQHFTNEELQPYLDRALKVVTAIRSMTYDDLFTGEIIRAPEPEQAICKRKAIDGVYVVPESMRYSPFRSVFYRLEQERDCYGKTKEYVSEMLYGDESERELERLIQSGQVTTN